METKFHVKYHVIPALILFIALVILDITIFKELLYRNQQLILAIVGVAWIVIFYIISPFKKLQLEQIKKGSIGKLLFDEEKLLIALDEKI